MIYVTGDTHRSYNRFSSDNFPEQKTMSKSDYVIICGDFGIWDKSNEEKHWMDWLEDKPFTTLFVDGNHENFDLLNSMPIEQWNGGNVHYVRPSVIHLMRGQLFNIDNKKIFTMGGATSHDIQDGILELDDPNFKAKRKKLDKDLKMYRINHLSYWKEEMPSELEYNTALDTLDKHNWDVDYIFSHCIATSVSDILGGGFYQPDVLTDFHEEIKQRCNFKYWFFGHYHDNRVISNKFICLYEQLIKIPE